MSLSPSGMATQLRRNPFLPVLFFFFVSGGCALLYQIVWTRRLVLLFGTTSYAVSTVLAIFFLGLGFGSLWGGRLADRSKRPLAVYGYFEILIGVWAALFIIGINWGDDVVASILRVVNASRGAGILLRAVLAGALLAVPVSLMGATFPLLARFATGNRQRHGMRVGLLYSINTFGALTGCILAGFVLLPAWGYLRSTLAGAVANVVIGLLALWLARANKEPAPEEPAEAPSPTEDPPRELGPITTWAVVASFGLSGFCALALEVLWTRLLVIVFIGTTYAFTTMLATVLCGIAVGSAVAAPLVDKRRHLVAIFGLVELLIASACVGALGLFAALPGMLGEMDVYYDWAALIRAKFFLSFCVLFVPTFFFGVGFPIVIRAATGPARLGRDVARLYSANTLGGVLGAIAGGYLILPTLGAHSGILFLSTLLLASGLILVALCPTRAFAGKVVYATAGCSLFALALWSAPADAGKTLTQSYISRGEDVIHYKEGVEGTIVVSQPPGATSGSDRQIWINGVQATSSYERGKKMNRYQGVLPTLLAKELQTGLVMCFGSGVTAGMLGIAPFHRIDGVEISQDVLDAAPFFEVDNFDVLNNARFNFVIDDGRNFLLMADTLYDVITFEPMPLALTGVASFYTREYYELCRDHLKPGGVVSQWFPLHKLGLDMVRALMRTFTEVFPEYSMWFINADVFLIGSNEPHRIDFAVAQERLSVPAVHDALQDVGFTDIYEVLSTFFAGKEGVDKFTDTLRTMSDDKPWAEFEAPRYVYRFDVSDALKRMAPLYESPLNIISTDSRTDEIAARIKRRHQSKRISFAGIITRHSGGMSIGQEDIFERALEVDPANADAAFYFRQFTLINAERMIAWDQAPEAEKKLSDSLRYLPKDPRIYKLLAEAYTVQGKTAEAASAYKRHLALGGKPEEARP